MITLTEERLIDVNKPDEYGRKTYQNPLWPPIRQQRLSWKMAASSATKINKLGAHGSKDEKNPSHRREKVPPINQNWRKHEVNFLLHREILRSTDRAYGSV